MLPLAVVGEKLVFRLLLQRVFFPLLLLLDSFSRILLFWMNLPLFGKLAHTHHFTVFYCEIGVVGK